MSRGFARRLVLVIGLSALSCATTGVDVDRALSDLGDPHWQVRASAAEALGRAKADRAIPALRAALLDDGPEVRAAASMALAELSARAAVDDIRMRIRDDEDKQVVVQALFALSVLASKDDPDRDATVDLIVSKLSEETERVDSAARRVLYKLFGRSGVLAMIRADLRSDAAGKRVRGSTMALALALPELSGWERERLDDSDAAARRNAYEALGRSATRADLSLLLRGLRDESAAVRLAAGRGLEELADPASLGPLEQAAGSDPDSAVREEAASAIAWISDIHGAVLPALWHFTRIDDRVTLDRSGSCTLARTFTLVIDRCPESIGRLSLLVPRKFPHVDRVVDAAGHPLAFEPEWQGGLRQVVFDVAPIEAGAPATFTLFARSRRPLSASSAGALELTYSPAPLQARVSALHVAVEIPANAQAATFDRSELGPREAEDFVVRVPVPASVLSSKRAPPRSYSMREDVTAIGVVVAVVLSCFAAVVVSIRRRREQAPRMILVAALTTGAVLLLSPMLLEDNLTYYALARSAVLDGDLDRANEYADFNQTQVYVPDPRGSLDPVFASVVRTPIVAAAHGLTAAIDAIAPIEARNGFSFPYLFLTAVGDFLAVLIGCLACFSLVERRVGARYALWSVLSVVAGTNLLLFAYAWTSSSFQPSFFLFAVFLNHWDATRDRRGAADWFGAGVLLGLLGITRTLNLGFVLIPLLDWLDEAVSRSKAAGLPGVLRHAGRGALLTAGMLLAFAPQILVARLVDQTLFVDAYGVGTGRFTGLLDHLWGLFLAEAGVFSTMPLLVLAIVGLVPLVRYDRRLGILVTAGLALQLLAIASYEIYWGYFWYGTPYLVPASPILCLAIAGLFRAVHVRWPRLGPAVATLAVVFCSARNGWCMVRQLATKMIGDWQAGMDIGPVLRAMLLLNRKLDVDVLRVSSEFGCLLREMAGGVRARDAGELLAALGFTALLLTGVLLVCFAGAIVRRLASAVPPRRLRPLVAAALAVSFLAVSGWLAVLGARTDLDYEYFVQREWTAKRELSVARLEPGRSYEWTYQSTNPSDRLSVITFLDEAVDVRSGEPVATVDIAAGDARSQVTLRAGIDTADFAIDRPEADADRGHSAPLDRACFEWRVRDDSSRFYTARAYCSVFATPVPARTTTLRLTSTLSHGAIGVVLSTSRERKIPPDRSRRRWLAERW